MSLFDQVMGGLASRDANHAALYQEVGQLVDQAGGVGGLAQKFQQGGLGSIISGWISTGPNPAISGSQLVSVIGQDKVAAIASKAGLSQQQVTDGISALLPLVVDHLTPNGTVPNHSSADMSSALNLLKGKLFGQA